MQPAQALDSLVPWAQKQMICVPKNDPGVEIVLEVSLRQSLDARLCSHRHENRCLDCSVRRVQQSRPGTRLRTLGLYLETKSGHLPPILCEPFKRPPYNVNLSGL
jgi:hypothetical protein